jgi:hypothetical protein
LEVVELVAVLVQLEEQVLLLLQHLVQVMEEQQFLRQVHRQTPAVLIMAQALLLLLVILDTIGMAVTVVGHGNHLLLELRWDQHGVAVVVVHTTLLGVDHILHQVPVIMVDPEVNTILLVQYRVAVAVVTLPPLELVRLVVLS